MKLLALLVLASSATTVFGYFCSSRPVVFRPEDNHTVSTAHEFVALRSFLGSFTPKYLEYQYDTIALELDARIYGSTKAATKLKALDDGDVLEMIFPVECTVCDKMSVDLRDRCRSLTNEARDFVTKAKRMLTAHKALSDDAKASLKASFPRSSGALQKLENIIENA